MLELRSRIIRNNGDRYYFTRSSTGIYRWIDAATNLGVPDSRARLLEHLYSHRIRGIRSSPKGSGTDAEIQVDSEKAENEHVLDARDVIMGNGEAVDNDIHYGLAVDAMEALTEMGGGHANEAYIDESDEDHSADANSDYPVEMVA